MRPFARTRSLIANLRRRLWRDERGNVAMMLALSIVPLSLAAMGAVDLTRGITAKVELQDALDAAALAAGRTNSTDPAALQSVGARVLAQNLAGDSDFSVTSATFTLGTNNTIEASVQASFNPSIGGLVGSGTMTLSASTEVVRADDILEIALVLDNTGSMADSLSGGSSKISYLRGAAANFVDTMANASATSTTPNSVQISLVPFSNTVNVGSSYQNASWIDGSAVSPINDQIFTTTGPGVTQHANRFTLFSQLHTTWGGCVENRQAPYDIQDTAPSSGTPATLFTPYFAPDEQDGVSGANDYVNEPHKDAAGHSLSWWQRQGNLTKYTTSPKVSLNTTTGPNAGCTMQQLQRLTTNFPTLKAAISAMVASGDTNIPMGLVWGWHTLSPNGPFGDGVPYLTAKHKKIVVLMTDGQDTMTANSATGDNSYYSGNGYVWQGRVLQADGTPLTDISSSADTRTAAMDDRLQKLCTNMKSASVGIEIYAIGVGVTTASRTLLQNCASGSDHYFDVNAGVDLNATFQNIANQIAQLHLSK